MRYLKIHLGGYIGIYNGIGSYSIDIDFTKCRYNKIAIVGDNGSGKSTLLNAISVFPDNNSCFIPGIPADKKIELLVDDGTIYIITFIHGINSKMERETAKGYITKVHPTGKSDELNPNGNITSCKETIFEEFGLDPNFIALSQLGSEDRGLVDKKPAERKRFINSIIGDELVIYNNIYKLLTKRSSELKALVNSINLKIKNLGDEPVLEANIGHINQRLAKLKTDEDSLNAEIGGLQATVASKDPSKKIEYEYNEIQASYSSLSNACDALRAKIDNNLSKYTGVDIDSILPVLEQIKTTKAELSIKLQIEENNISNLLSTRESEANMINSKIAKIKTLSNDKNIDTISSEIESIKHRLNELKDAFSRIGIQDANNLSKDEYISGLNLLKEIKEIVDIFISEHDYGIITEAIQYSMNSTYPNIEDISKERRDIDNRIAQLEQTLIEFRCKSEIINKLTLRPSSCKIDSCGFINDALQAEKEYPVSQIPVMEEELNILKNKSSELLSREQQTMEIIEVINSLNSIIRSINNHRTILEKLPNGDIFSNKDIFLNKLANGNKFNEINILYTYIDYANSIEEYKVLRDKLNDLEKLYATFKSEIILINNIQEEIDEINDRLNEVDKDISGKRSELLDIKSSISDLCDKELILESILTDIEKFNEIEIKKSELEKRFEAIKQDVMNIQLCTSRIGDLQNQIRLINETRIPLEDDKSKFMHNIQTLKEYKEELQVYMQEYQKVEAIKYYSSPNTGIQTLFIGMYMNNVLSMANEMLSMLFNAEYSIQPFIINEDEFRIPCLGNGFINDDISSMSTSEKCMISMIISFALLFQSATSFNILKLDEIDGGLDYSNRMVFNDLLNKYMQILNCAQCIFISHNSEGVYYDCDVILLKNMSNREVDSANIIYDYRVDYANN